MESGSVVSAVSAATEVRPQSNSSAISTSSSSESSGPAEPIQAASASAAPVSDDAVTVDLSQNAEAQASSEPDASATAAKNNSEASISRDQAEKIAKRYEAALNETQVRFKVSLEERGNNVINFQVVEKETGRIVRQFPPDKIMALEENATVKPGTSGKIFDSSG